MTLTDFVAQWRSLRAQRLELEKQAAELKEKENECKESIIGRLRKSANKAISTNGRVIQLVVSEKPVVDKQSWPLLWKHILKTGQIELVQQRLNTKAVEEHWAAGEKIPGVQSLPVETLSDTKAK